MIRKLLISVTSGIAMLMVGSAAWAVPTTYDAGPLDFTSSNQSMWGPGAAFQLDETYFAGVQWNESTKFGSIGNFPGTGGTIPNPAYGVWFVAYEACRVAFSHDTCVNGTIITPGLGNAPSTTLPNPIPGVKTGLEVTLATDGRVGFEFGVKIDSGSVNAEVGYDNVTAIVPDREEIVANGRVVNLNPNADLTGDDLNSQFPTIVLTSEVIFDLYASASGQACIADCITFSESIDIDPDLPIVSFNEDGEGGIEWFGGNPDIEALFNLSGNPLPSGLPADDVSIGDLIEVDLFLPQPNATYDGTDGTNLYASGQDDLINVTLDIDNAISLLVTSGATPNIYGDSLDIGIGSINWDFVDIDFGPALDLRQEFTLTPTLMVDLMFSKPVNYLGNMVTFIQGLEWQSLPDLMFAGGATTITPTYYLQYGADANTVKLLNQLIIDINGRLELDLLSFGFDIGAELPFGLGFFGLRDSWSLASIIKEFGIGQVPIFDTMFAMGGFNRIEADAFVVTVPEPGTLALFGLGLLMLGMRRRRNS